MAILTAGELTNLRTTQHSSNLYLSVLQPATLLSALVNNVSIARGARSISYDTGTGSATGYGVVASAVANGVSDNIGTALMLEVDTATGTELVRIKSITGNETTGTITVAENGINWGNNFPIRVKHFFQIAPVFPAIRSGVFYKDYDIVFATAYATQPNPVAVAGPHLAGFLSAGSIAFALTSASSYAVAQGATISSTAWVCVHNGGATANISFSDTGNNTSAIAAPTLTISAVDTYWLSCQVTDSNGKIQTTYRAIFVYDANNPPEIDFSVQSLTADWDSAQWRCTLNITGDSTLTDLPNGSLAVLWYQNYFNATEAYVNVWTFGDNIVYTGYLWSDNDSDNWQTGTGAATFEIISPLAYLDAITDYGTVSLEAKTSPALWSDYASWLTVGRGIHHLLKWDTTILQVCDVLGLTDNTYGVKTLEFTEETLLQRIQGVAFQRGIHAKLVSNRLGQLYLVRDSQMLNTAGRAALDTVCTLATTDISGGVNLVRNNETVRAFADLDGFTYSHPTSAPFISMIPGYVESTVSYNLPHPRGIGTEQDKQQVLNSAGGQTDCNERAGRRLALANVSPREVRINMRGNYLGAFDIVPSIGWYNWGIANNALKRELDLNGVLFVCRSINHQFGYTEDRFNGVIQTTEVVLQPEAQGPDGIPGNYPTTYPAITTPAPSWDTGGAGGAASGFITAWIAGNSFQAAVGQLGSITFGSTYDIDAVIGTCTACIFAVANLSATKAIAAYNDDSADGVAKVLDVAGTVITPGAGAIFHSGNVDLISIVGLSATKAIAFYVNPSTKDGIACVLDVSGATVTPGAEQTVSAGVVEWTGIARLSATKAIAAYRDDNEVTTLQAVVLDISGSTITVNSPQTLNARSADFVAVCALNSSTAVVAYRRQTNQDLEAVVLSSITTTFTVNAAAVLADDCFDNFPGFPFIATIDSTHAVIGYQTDSSPFIIRAIAVENSSGTLSAGSSVPVSAGSGYDEYPATAYLGNGKAVVSFDLTSTNGKTTSLTIAGTTITNNVDETAFITSASLGPNTICALKDI